MAKAKVKQRKDNKGRVLQKGESQRKLDGMYIYCCSSTYLMFLSSDYFRLHLFNLINLINEVKATSSHYINKLVIQ